MLSDTNKHCQQVNFINEIQIIRTKVLKAQTVQPIKSIVITSPMAKDGKTVLAVNLAKSIAYTGKSVVYIHANLRDTTSTSEFLLDSNGEYGLSDYLHSTDDLPYSKILFSTDVKNLSVVPNRVVSEDAADLLSSQRFIDLVDLLKQKFDFLILDAAEIVERPDSMNLVGQADAVILVARLKHTLKSSTSQAVELLHELDANVLGWVLGRS